MSAASAKSADPSMEEILASIRRIIADDDERAPGAETAKDGATDETAPGLDAGAPRDSGPEQDHDDDILDLASVPPPHAASLDVDVPNLSFQAAPPAPTPSLPDAEPDPFSPRGPVSTGDDASPPPHAPAGSASRDEAPSFEPARPAPQGRVMERPHAENPSRPADAQPPSAGQPAVDAIVSQQTSTSVNHAFNLLSHTIMSQNAQTLEDIVREMLKPMLKTWLDDNLPPLVERLVAEEIQRVARGRR